MNKRKKELIKKFGSIAKMELATKEELETILPPNVADNLQKYLQSWKEAKKKE